MGLTNQFIESHILHWEEVLRQSYRPHRANWPSRVFHHAPIENAARILLDGQLLSRTQSQNRRGRDVASAEVIASRDDAHNYVRLYFRPRTPTQFHIEGIRNTSEFYQNDPRIHAPVLVMFVFDARQILALPDISFSDINMQSPYAQRDDTEIFFSKINFLKVFHEGGIGGDHSIISSRCAEVLVPSPMAIQPSLQAIYCRSAAEKEMLLQTLGADSDRWSPYMRVSNDLMIFDKRFTYCEEIALQNNGLVFRFNPRSDGRNVKAQIRLRDESGHLIVNFGPQNMRAIPSSTQKWIIEAKLKPGATYHVEVHLEECLAFSGFLRLEDLPF